MKQSKEEKEKRWLTDWQKTRTNKWRFICIQAILKGLVVGSVMFLLSSLSDPAQYFTLSWFLLYLVPAPFLCVFYGIYLYRTNERYYSRMLHA